MARLPLLRLENRFTGTSYEKGSARGGAALRQAHLEFEHIRGKGHTPRLEYLVGLAHLAYAFPNEAAQQRIHKSASPLLEEIFNLGKNDVHAATEVSAPLAYFISYPRSGNTLAMRLTAMATHGQVLSAMRGTVAPFSKAIYPKCYSLTRLIKDHSPHLHYLQDRCVLIVRDGRDTMISLAFMTLQGNSHSFKERGEVADFIRWTEKSYPFGSWAAHVRNLFELFNGQHKLLVRYEDLVSDEATFFKIVDFVDPDNPLPREHLSKLFDQRDRVVRGNQVKASCQRQMGLRS